MSRRIGYDLIHGVRMSSNTPRYVRLYLRSSPSRPSLIRPTMLLRPRMGVQPLRLSHQSSAATPSVPQAFRSPFSLVSLLVMGLSCVGLSTHQLTKDHTQALESNENFASAKPQRRRDISDITPWVPYSIEDVDDYLLVRQANVELGPDSHTLRIDYTQLESNLPMEDFLSPFSGFGGLDGFDWLIGGVYDGHWYL